MTASSDQESLKVAFVIGTADPGGAEGQLTRLAAGLVSRGHRVTVYFLVSDGPLTHVLDEGGVPWHVFAAIRPDNPRSGKVRDLVRFVRHLRRGQYDIVYAWLPGVIWLTLPVATAFTRARRVAAFRGLVQTFEVRTPLRRRVFGSALKRAHAVTANAPWLEEEAVRWGARPDRVRFMPNGVQLPGSTASVAAQPPRAVVVANFFAYKRHELVVRLMAAVPGFDTTFVGSGELLQATKSLADDLGVRDRMRFVEDSHSVSELLLECQFAIHPSSTEGMSNAILEELAHGLPVVATDVGAIGLLITDSVEGFVVPAEDLATMTDRVGRLVNSPALRERMSTLAREKANTFSWNTSLDRHEQLFRDLVQSQE